MNNLRMLVDETTRIVHLVVDDDVEVLLRRVLRDVGVCEFLCRRHLLSFSFVLSFFFGCSTDILVFCLIFFHRPDPKSKPQLNKSSAWEWELVVSVVREGNQRER